MGVMTDYRNRFVRSRNYEFTEDQMRKYRIVGVFNSIADVDYMNEDYMDRFIVGCYDSNRGENAISESGIYNGVCGIVRILSVIVFSDVESMELYILSNPGLYLPVDRSMNGRMN